MAELNFAHLLAESALVPAGSIVDDPTDGVLIKVGAFIGETVDDLTDEKVVEFTSRFLEACRAAQLTFNNNGGTPLPAAQQINSFGAELYGGVQTTSGGEKIVTETRSVVSRIPLNSGDRRASLAAL